MTTIVIEDLQSVPSDLLVEFYEHAKGRTDVWYEVENEKPKRLNLWNGEVQWPYSDDYKRLKRIGWDALGVPFSLTSIFDDDDDAKGFTELLERYQSKVVSYFDIEELPDRDEFHDWIVSNCKGRVLVWKTYGTTGHMVGPNESFIERWKDEDFTVLVGLYDPQDGQCFPTDPDAALFLPEWFLEDEYHFLRVMLAQPNDAMLFRLTWGGQKSQQPESFTAEELKKPDWW